MSAALLPPSLSSIFSSSVSKPYPLHYVSPPFNLAAASSSTRPSRSFLVGATANYADPSDLSLISPTSDLTVEALDQKLLTLLRQRKTEDAWIAYTNSAHDPSPTCLSRLVSQLSFQNARSGLTRVQSIVTRLRHERQLHRLDTNCLGLLAVAATKAGYISYATSIVKSRFRSLSSPREGLERRRKWPCFFRRRRSGGSSQVVQSYYSACTKIQRPSNSFKLAA